MPRLYIALITKLYIIKDSGSWFWLWSRGSVCNSWTELRSFGSQGNYFQYHGTLVLCIISSFIKAKRLSQRCT